MATVELTRGGSKTYTINGDVHIYTGGEWKAGKVWIYTSSGWKRAENVFVYNGSAWKNGISTK